MNWNNVEFEAAFGTLGQLSESDLPEICFSGRSNVGKSSLLNKLFNRKQLARVSSVPGKTVTINFYDVENIKFVDLPGYGYAKLSRQELNRFAELMEGYFKTERNIALVVQLIDMRHPATDFDLWMLGFLSEMNLPFTVVLTKSDKLNKTEYNNRLELIKTELKEFIDNTEIIPFTVNNSDGAEALRKIIESVDI